MLEPDQWDSVPKLRQGHDLPQHRKELAATRASQQILPSLAIRTNYRKPN